MKKATLVLENGTVMYGNGFGAEADTVFELVFNTSMTGYQEILSDPSYRGQGVMFTSSQIGNVGINPEDHEANRAQPSAVIIRALSLSVSNWRASLSLPDWLAQQGIPGISGIDTRFLTRKLRDHGTQKAALSTTGASADKLLDKARQWPGLDGRDMVQEVTGSFLPDWTGDAGDIWLTRHPGEGTHIVVIDYGVKRNILRHLTSWGARVTILPAYTNFREITSLQPDGVLLSNGPGDPAGLPQIVATVAQLIDSGMPVFGICLGHQLIGRALGGQTQRLKFGHHGGNHPVQDLRTGKALITAQNHNYAVVAASLDPDLIELTHRSLNDQTLEGMRLRHRPVFSVQFHPEAAPGPHDAHGLFAEFFTLIQNTKRGAYAQEK